jgi:hypothetical protein
MTLRLRDLTDDERTEVQRITRSHTLQCHQDKVLLRRPLNIQSGFVSI